jgi:sucrose synthase
MELNLAPFYDYSPSFKDPESIGDGIKQLNRHMSNNIAQFPEKWGDALYEFLKLHHLHGMQLLLDGNTVRSKRELESVLEDVVDFLERSECPDDLDTLRRKLRRFGFLDGWGDNQKRILETINLLQDILEQPADDTLEEFLSRIPMVSKVALISPHGWFGQENVLGRPDTGGQVVYVLDQAKALEKYLVEDVARSGLDIEPKVLIVTRLIPDSEGTTAHERLEKVYGTNNVWILRVPFRDDANNVVPQWISRFRVWPFLDQFAEDTQAELLKEFGTRPDLLVGNYSDGNIVAAQLSKRLGVIQCNIAHALEKSKYLFSDLYWDRFEEEYHFSVQFMADLIAMNMANFIITSTRQEITGTDSTIGQYESYQFFTLPGLMHVSSGINLFHPRYNVIPPGVSTEVFFPHTQKKRRVGGIKKRLVPIIYDVERQDCAGRLDNPSLPPIFSIARMDRIKNLTGLAEAFGANKELRSKANLIIVASTLDPARSSDAEEADEIRHMHDLIARYDLRGSMRWIGRRLTKEETGEAYRIMADRQGIFVQPALFEAFGLTILEAMHSGLPVFATQFGGPLEIIEPDISGFLINPTDHESMTRKINDFFDACRSDPKHWRDFSQRGIERAHRSFTWELHCRRLTRLTKVYGFWRYSISQQAKSRMAQYCHLLYHLYFKARARQIP